MADALSWDEFRARIRDLYSTPAHAPRTRAKMAHVLDLAGRLGLRSTAELTTELAARYVAARMATVSANTVRGELGYLRAAAAIALEEGWLDRPPRWRRAWPRPSPRRRATLHSIEEIERALQCLAARASDWQAHRLYALVALVAYTGLRRDEALYAMVEDVDLARRILEVSSRRRLKTPGSAAAVPLCHDLVAILEGWLPRAGSTWLFPGTRCRGPWTGGSGVNRAAGQVRRLGRELGIEGLTLLSLRHSFATWARRRWGLSALELRDVLRHATVHTQEHYVHEADHAALVQSVAGVSYGAKKSPRVHRDSPG